MKVIQSLFIVLMVFFLFPSSSNAKNAILGKWEETDGTETIEFFRDGTVNIVDKGRLIAGGYRFIDDDRLRLDLGGLGALAGSMILKVSVSGNELILTNPQGEVSRYRRMERDPDRKALEILSEALEVAETTKDSPLKAQTFARIAMSYNKACQKDKALEILAEGLQVAETITEASLKAEALGWIAGSYVEAGQKDKASEILSEALQAAQGIRDSPFKASALASIVVNYRE